MVSEVVLKPIIGGRRGNYRLTYYWIDPTMLAPRGRGLALSFDQAVGDKYGLFMRFGQADGRRRNLCKFVNCGIVALEPFGWKNDRVGLGFVWGQPTDHSENNQYGLETFYRWQLTARMQLSSDLQIIFDPSQTASRQAAAVGCVRMRWIF